LNQTLQYFACLFFYPRSPQSTSNIFHYFYHYSNEVSSILSRPSLSNPNLEDSFFTEKLNNDHLGYYYRAAIIFFFTYLSYLTSIGLHYIRGSGPTERLTSILYGISLLILAVIALIYALSLFLQFQAIKLRSIEKQDSCIKLIEILLVAQTCATIFNSTCAIFMESMNIVSAIFASIIPLAVGMSLLFLALKTRSIMLRRNEKIMELIQSTFHFPDQE